MKVKICCMLSVQEIALAAGAGADLVGLVGPMPTGPGTLSLDNAAKLSKSVPDGVEPVLLTSSTTHADLERDLRLVQPGAVQIVQHVPRDVHEFLTDRFPEVSRLQVIHVEGSEAVDLVAAYGDAPDAFLLDSGRPSANELGGTGRVHDWSVSRACVEAAERPVFLAGGLTPGNVSDAIRQVRPQGIDVCSGVRTDDRLDPVKLSAFMAHIRGAP